jgi:branched-chain amino acid transport system substrate-binding protein
MHGDDMSKASTFLNNNDGGESAGSNSFVSPILNPHGITRRRLLTGAALAAGALSVPTLVRAQPARIPIGCVVGLTGPAGPWGTAVSDATRLAIEQINASGGIKSKGGAQIDLTIADHQSNPQMAGTQTERVIQVNKVLAVFGTATSGCTMVASAVADKYKTSMLSTDAADTLTTRGLKHYFRIGAPAGRFSELAVEFSIATAKSTGVTPKKIATMADDSTFSQEAIKGVLAQVKKTGWDFAQNVTFPGGHVSDFAPMLQRLRLAGVDLIFHAMFAPDAIQLMRSMKALNYDLIASVHVLGAPYVAEYTASLKGDADFVTDAVGFVPEMITKIPSLAAFEKAYKERYKKDLDDQSSLAVTAVGALYDALERAPELSREAITSALRSADLALGANPFVVRDGVKFSSDGQNVKASAVVMQILNEQQRIVYPADKATAKVVWPMPKFGTRPA